jgi:hypothetical protein
MEEVKQPPLDLRLSLSTTVDGAAERQASQDAQSLIHSVINPSLRTRTKERHGVLWNPRMPVEIQTTSRRESIQDRAQTTQ